MTPIRILHASDLHLAHKPKLRSWPDKFTDGIIRSLRRRDHAPDPNRGFFGRSADFLGRARAFLTAKASSYDPAVLEHLAEFMYWEHYYGRLDGVILTGDIATTGRRKDIARVDRVFNDPADAKLFYTSRFTCEGTLSFITPPVFMKFFAGNHDRFVLTPAVGRTTIRGVPAIVPKVFDVGGTRFDTVRFKRDPMPKNPPVEKFSKARRSANNRILRVWIFTADFTLRDFGDHEGLWGWLAQGKVYTDVLDKLITETQKVIAEKKEIESQCILWACHFPPQFPNERTDSKLIGGDLLVKAANDLGVTAILTGHTHEQTSYSRPGMKTEILCCGTTTQFEPDSMPGGRHAKDPTKGNHFQILNIDEGAKGEIVLTVENYRYKHSVSVALPGGGMASGPGRGQTNWERLP
jgi:hypothetical protein